MCFSPVGNAERCPEVRERAEQRGGQGKGGVTETSKKWTIMRLVLLISSSSVFKHQSQPGEKFRSERKSQRSGSPILLHI